MSSEEPSAPRRLMGADLPTGLNWVGRCAEPHDDWCVEAVRVRDDVLLRSSRDPEGPVLLLDPREARKFLELAKSGAFDHLAA